MFFLIRIALIAVVGFFLFRWVFNALSEAFSDSKKCPRCEGKGYWQNTRNRETCEWCAGEGRLPKDFPV